jgi:hypothetical protein
MTVEEGLLQLFLAQLAHHLPGLERPSEFGSEEMGGHVPVDVSGFVENFSALVTNLLSTLDFLLVDQQISVVWTEGMLVVLPAVDFLQMQLLIFQGIKTLGTFVTQKISSIP